LPGADYHLAVVRTGPSILRPDGAELGRQEVLCEEPSPDWAIAFGTAFAGAASGGASGGPSGSVSGSATTTEVITALAGRTAGVVALRDGLYSACQAYANQLIGKDAYSLILSQYGNLLVALASGGGGGATTAAPASATPPGVAVAVSTGGASGSAKPPGTPSGSNASEGGNSEVPVMQQEAVQALLVACISYNIGRYSTARMNYLTNIVIPLCNSLAVCFPIFLNLPERLTNQQAGQNRLPREPNTRCKANTRHRANLRCHA
jgi:hypothetical protein